MDGLAAGSCPGATLQTFAGVRSVRVGEALGNNRYLVYENEQVVVLKDSTQNLTATLSPSTSEKSPAIAFALGVKPLSSIAPPFDSNIAAFNPDATILALGAETNSIWLYKVADGKTLRRLGDVGEYWVSFVTTLSFSADGRLLASNGLLYDKATYEINIWDVSTGQRLRAIQVSSKVSSVALSPDGKLLAAAVKPNTISLWRLEDGKLLWNINSSWDGHHSLIFSPDGRMLISGHRGEGKVYVYDARTAGHLRTLQGNLVTLGRDGRMVTYSYKNGVVTRNIWRSPTSEQAESGQVEYSPDESCLNEQIMVRGVELRDAYSQQLMVKLRGNYCLAVSANGGRLLTHGGGNGHAVWSLPAIPGDVPN